jgi:hypothetical protein
LDPNHTIIISLEGYFFRLNFSSQNRGISPSSPNMPTCVIRNLERFVEAGKLINNNGSGD